MFPSIAISFIFAFANKYPATPPTLLFPFTFIFLIFKPTIVVGLLLFSPFTYPNKPTLLYPYIFILLNVCATPSNIPLNWEVFVPII